MFGGHQLKTRQAPWKSCLEQGEQMVFLFFCYFSMLIHVSYYSPGGKKIYFSIFQISRGEEGWGPPTIGQAWSEPPAPVSRTALQKKTESWVENNPVPKPEKVTMVTMKSNWNRSDYSSYSYRL